MSYTWQRLLQHVLLSKRYTLFPHLQLHTAFSITDFKGNSVHIIFIKRITLELCAHATSQELFLKTKSHVSLQQLT